MCSCAHPGGILPRFPLWHMAPRGHTAPLSAYDGTGMKHIIHEFPAFIHYKLTVLSWMHGSSSRQIMSCGVY